MACVFCGAAGKLTAEHVFGDWLSRIGLSNEAPVHTAGWLNRSPRDLGTTKPFKTTVRDVCGTCNSGWMSRLEAAASRVLTPLILGKSGTVEVVDQPIIAAWAHKTALVNMLVSSADDRARGYGLPAVEYWDLYSVREKIIPAEATQFWIGRYQGRQRTSVCVAPMIIKIQGLPEAAAPQAYVIVIIIGELFIQGVRFTAPGLEIEIIPGDALLKLWPASVTPVRWPPTESFDDVALSRASKGFNLNTPMSAIQIGPWRTATDMPESTLEGSLIRLPTPCGLHFVFYPAELGYEARRGNFYSFSTSCECGKSYIIRTEPDGAHFKAEGEPARISSQYEALHGEERVFEDEGGLFVCKRSK